MKLDPLTTDSRTGPGGALRSWELEYGENLGDVTRCFTDVKLEEIASQSETVKHIVWLCLIYFDCLSMLKVLVWPVVGFSTSDLLSQISGSQHDGWNSNASTPAVEWSCSDGKTAGFSLMPRSVARCKHEMHRELQPVRASVWNPGKNMGNLDGLAG
jgi:hypothetical protein